MKRGLNVNAAPFLPLGSVDFRDLQDTDISNMGFIGTIHRDHETPASSLQGYGVFPVKDDNNVAFLPIGINEEQVEMAPPQELWIPLDLGRENDIDRENVTFTPLDTKHECDPQLSITETQYRILIEKATLLNTLLCDLRNLQHPTPIYAVDEHDELAFNLEKQVST